MWLVTREHRQDIHEAFVHLDRAEADRKVLDRVRVDLVEGEHRDELVPDRVDFDAGPLAGEVRRTLDSGVCQNGEGPGRFLGQQADRSQREVVIDEVDEGSSARNASP